MLKGEGLMPKCIKCDIESEHSICEQCVEELVANMSPEDLVSHALVGVDAMKGKGNLLERLRNCKSQLETK